DLLAKIGEKTGQELRSRLDAPEGKHGPPADSVVPPQRQRYLAEIAETVRGYHRRGADQVSAARRRQRLAATAAEIPEVAPQLEPHLAQAEQALEPGVRAYLEDWPSRRERYAQDELVYTVRGREMRQPLVHVSLSQQRIPRVVLPDTEDHGEIVRYAWKENVPGEFPYTAGVFPLRREGEDPKRMFAGEGGPDKTNARFHYLCKGETAHRLSTAF